MWIVAVAMFGFSLHVQTFERTLYKPIHTCMYIEKNYTQKEETEELKINVKIEMRYVNLQIIDSKMCSQIWI